MTTIHLLTITPPNTLFPYKKKKTNGVPVGIKYLAQLGRVKKGEQGWNKNTVSLLLEHRIRAVTAGSS